MQIRRVGCSARRIIDEVLRTLRYRADEKGLALSSQWIGPDDQVFTDPSRLRQLLINLVNNAIKFTPSGSVHIRAGVELRAGSRTLKIEVADTGIGIDASKQQAIFEPFVQADGTIAAQYGGTGLGLAISRSIAGLLGGRLVVTSRLGVGSTFTLTISAGSPDTAHAAEANGVEAQATIAGADLSLRGCRILLAEDNPHNRKLLQIALTRAGAQVELAENGEVAVDRAQANKFDLVLMDMQMPVLDGFAAVARLRGSNYRGPIVALTAHALPAERERCLAEGCDAFISKPVDLDHLLEVIHQLLSSRERLRAACLLDSDRGCGTRDEQELHEVAREYVASLHNTLVELRTELADRRYDELAAIGHTLKGSGGTIGYPQVSAIGQRLEQAAHEQLAGTVQQAICDLEEFLGSPQNS